MVRWLNHGIGNGSNEKKRKSQGESALQDRDNQKWRHEDAQQGEQVGSHA
jgi:hypothetical protein